MSAGGSPNPGRGWARGGAFPERDEGCSEAAQPMGWLGLVAMATVVRQSKEGDAGLQGVQSPPPASAGVAGPGAGAGREPWQDEQPPLGPVHSLGRPMRIICLNDF